MALPTDEKLLDTACDVAIRFRAHVIRGRRCYGDETGALRALRRRAPGFSPEEYQSVFRFLCTVYDRAAEAVPRHQVRRPGKTTTYAEFEDIDYPACLAILDGIEPGLAMKEKRSVLNWCIFWHYLK